MSSKHKHIAFLCGHFKMDKAITPSTLKELGWEPFVYSEVARNNENRFYYPDFVDFCYSDSIDQGCVRYTRPIDKQVSMVKTEGDAEQKLSFTVKEITLYFMPQQMLLYSIKVEQEVATFAECSRLMFYLRFIDGFVKEADFYSNFCKTAIDPIVEVYNDVKHKRLQNYTCLVENGNKLRIYQIIHAAEGSLANDEDRKRQLYQLATFMPVATDGNHEEDSLFTEHQKQEISKNSVAVFPGWTALAMLDTFTILASDSEKQTENWEMRYFGMIYIQALFQKTCLFDFNNRFKTALNKGKSKQVKRLISEYESFERRCCFNKISYNFLPQLMWDTIHRSLETKDEMHQLFKVMAREKSNKEENSRKNMNTLLFAISFMTLFSAICDLGGITENLFKDESRLIYIIAMVAISIIVIVMWLFLYYRRNNS